MDARMMNDWLNSMQTLLKSVDHKYIQSCSISIVPEELKNSSNKQAYMPRVVSIGPRFKGSREDLLLMEEVKLRSMLSLLHRAGDEGESTKYFEKCSEAIWKLDKEIRASYVSDIKINKQELAKIMLVDGCFLLELLITKGLNNLLPSRSIPPGPAPKVLKYEDVLSDLILLENQIPFLILHTLSIILFPNVFKPDQQEQRSNEINNLVLSILGYPQSSQVSDPSHLVSPHILDIVHFFVNRRKNGEKESGSVVGNHVVLTIDPTELKLKRCASRLEAAGITIKLAEEKGSEISFISYLRSCFGDMFIKLGNMLLTNNNQVDAPAEVKGLDFYLSSQKQRKQSGDLKMSDEELEEFFRTMSFGVDPGIVDSSYVKMVDELNNYSHTFFILRIFKTF